MPSTGVFRDSPTATMLQTSASWVQQGTTTSCLDNANASFFTQNYVYPQWFFDWGKKYLLSLRMSQPDFSAPVEEKLIWVTHVAWTLNMMMGSTNLHGSLMSMALYQEASGVPFTSWAENGSFMFPSIHTRGLPVYYQQEVDLSLQALLSKGVPRNAVFDYGDTVFDKTANPVGQSHWMGTPFSTPLETRRLRWATPCFVKNDCPVRGRCTEVVKPIQGLTFGNGYPNDPTYVPQGDGSVAYDAAESLNNYTRWSYAIPWVMGVQSWGSLDSSKFRNTQGSLLETAVRMSTFFSWAGGDSAFWNALSGWKTRPSPGFRSSGSWANTGRSHYTPNEEFCFRYYYPAMIDMVNRVDYASLVTTGLNLWWRFNVGALDVSIASTAPKPTSTKYGPDGVLLRAQKGDPWVAPVAPPGECQEARSSWEKSKDEAGGLSFLVNYVRTLVAVVQVVFGSYGAIVGAAKGWYDHFTKEYPRSDDMWRGVVPPTPLVQRLAPLGMFLGADQIPSSAIMPAPDPHGAGSGSPTIQARNRGGLSVAMMMTRVRSAVAQWSEQGAPFLPTSDVLNYLASRSPSAPASPSYPQPPRPGSSEEFVNQDVATAREMSAAPAVSVARPPVAEPPSAVGWLAGTVAAVGAFAVYRINRRRK